MAVIRNIGEATIAAINAIEESGFKLVGLNKPMPLDEYPQFIFEKVIFDDESEWCDSDDFDYRLDIYYSDSWAVSAGCGVHLDCKLLKSVVTLIELLDEGADRLRFDGIREVYGIKEGDND